MRRANDLNNSRDITIMIAPPQLSPPLRFWEQKTPGTNSKTNRSSTYKNTPTYANFRGADNEPEADNF